MDESGRTREAEARYNLSQDGEAVQTHVQDAGQRAPPVLASSQECQEGRCGCLGRLLFVEGEVVGVAGLAVVLDEAHG